MNRKRVFRDQSSLTPLILLILKNIENVMLCVSGALKYDIRATSCEI